MSKENKKMLSPLLSFLTESLPVVTLEAVGILGFELMSFFSLSSEKNKARILEEVFMGVEEVKILLEKCCNNQYCDRKGTQTYIKLVYLHHSHIRIYKRNLTKSPLL